MSASENPESVNSATSASDSPASTTGDTPVRRKRRRWPRRLGIAVLALVVLLALVVGFAPQIASTQAVSGFAVSVLNDRLMGKLELDGLSLSWL